MSERKRTAKNKSGIANCRIDGDAECTRKSQRVLQFAICISQFAILSVLSAPLAAQVTVIEDGENRITTYRMTVSPAPEPEPAFKYRLLKHEDERKAGNAAPFYYRAMLNKDRARKAIQEEHGDTYYDWMHIEDFPLAELPLDTIRKLPDIFGIDDLREATSRSHCDWGWDLRSQRGPELFQFILTEVQEFRGISRMLALKTRLAIAENRYDDAIEFTQMNYQVGRDAATEPYLVCSLVGIAVCGISNLYTLELMAAPDSPNLYWALAALPRPFVDVRPSIELEMDLLEPEEVLLIRASIVDEIPLDPALERKWDRAAAKVRKIMRISQEPMSLETPVGAEDSSQLGDFIEDETMPEPVDAAARELLKEQVKSALLVLTERERQVLEMRFGLKDGKDYTLEEVGKYFKVTRERIRQIEAKALRKLRHPTRSRHLKDYLS